MTLRDLLPDLGRRTLVMGILNVTPDSFSDGGRFLDPADALKQARDMAAAGADIIDIGGESTRPGAPPVSAAEEASLVIPVIELLHRELPAVPISIDTTKASVAEAAIEAGASIINDVSGGTIDPEMLPTAARLVSPICLMHLPVKPEKMGWSRAGGGLDSNDDAVAHVVEFLEIQVAVAEAAGVRRENILIDPGFGFGKTAEQNLDVLRRTAEIKTALGGVPLLLGPSRKSTIGKILGPEADRADPERIAGTAALVTLAAAYGADIVRVHDVEFMARVVKMADAVVRLAD